MVFIAEVADDEVGHWLGTVSPEVLHPRQQFVAFLTLDQLGVWAVDQKDEDAITSK